MQDQWKINTMQEGSTPNMEKGLLRDPMVGDPCKRK